MFGQSQRFVLIEEFSQASCGPCLAANINLYALMSANATKATSLKYQVVFSGPDPMNAQNKADAANRVSYYNVNGIPSSHMDGGLSAIPTQEKIDIAYTTPSPFSMKLTHRFNTTTNPDSIFIECEITCTQTITLDLPKIRVAMTEKTIEFTSPPGTNGEKIFYDVMRKMYPDPNGTAVTESWTVGQTQKLYFKEQIPAYIYKISEIAVVAWMQDDFGKKVLQTAYSPFPEVTAIDNFNNAVYALSVYPNPSSGIFTTSFEIMNTDNYSVKITNAIGQVVYEEVMTNFNGKYSKEINISSYGQGVYMLKISGSKGGEVKKLITY